MDARAENELCTLAWKMPLHRRICLPLPFLTTGIPLLVEQDALYRSPDQHSTPCLLNDRDDVKGKLTGAPPWVVRTTLIVVKKESIDEKAGLFRRDT